MRFSSLMRRTLLAAVVALALFPLAAGPAGAAQKKSFKLAWSIYVGFMPWPYAESAGILKKWADKYGITIELVQINDYVESINQYTAGQFDGVEATNMDALTIPAAGGVDTTLLIIGDFSNGNDGIVIKGKGKSLKDLKGMDVSLVQFSVSHYLLARALQSAGIPESDIKEHNISDADFVAAYATPQVKAIVAWNPGLVQIVNQGNNSLVFQSTQIPGEIMDCTVVNTQTLKDNPAFGKALAGAWYETMAVMTKGDAKATAAKEYMAKLSGTDLAGFEQQLKATRLFADPGEAAKFIGGPDGLKIMDLVRTFSFEHGLLGKDVTSKDAIGIAFPGGKVLGDAKNVKFRFDDSYMAMAAAKKL